MCSDSKSHPSLVNVLVCIPATWALWTPVCPDVIWGGLSRHLLFRENKPSPTAHLHSHWWGPVSSLTDITVPVGSAQIMSVKGPLMV